MYVNLYIVGGKIQIDSDLFKTYIDTVFEADLFKIQGISNHIGTFKIESINYN